MRVQTSVCEVLIDVRVCKTVKEMKKAEDEDEVCTFTLSIFQ